MAHIESTRRTAPGSVLVSAYLVPFSLRGRSEYPQLVEFEQFHAGERPPEEVVRPVPVELTGPNSVAQVGLLDDQVTGGWSGREGFIVIDVTGNNARAWACFYAEYERKRVLRMRWWTAWKHPRQFTRFLVRVWWRRLRFHRRSGWLD